ncbi:low molecular weight phosphotyrosine protein phosphatase [Halosquirtibacter xylanolyticus]|uniref:low molecular weight protein-tyrosine-phosphatase n=1 Tax=Halosquirtibacter xylanolyticus TaxID=3374599 RepID=UPI0037479439|nr:low molecular weight phosphotyrosine protein phosphatase [Prolixibacteraceae bacterium]
MENHNDTTTVLFICLGNICRSPTAEAIFKKYVSDEGLDDQFEIDSAGMIGNHEGSRADGRMRKHAEKRDFVLESLSRPFDKDVDFDRFDYIIAMDGSNISDLKSRARNEADLSKLHRMTDYCVGFDYDTVPDPYYGGAEGFELVLDILEDSCKGLLDKIKK